MTIVVYVPIRQGVHVVEAIEPDPKKVVHQNGAVSRVGVYLEDSRWVCIIKCIAQRGKSNLVELVIKSWLPLCHCHYAETSRMAICTHSYERISQILCGVSQAWEAQRIKEVMK